MNIAQLETSRDNSAWGWSIAPRCAARCSILSTKGEEEARSARDALKLWEISVKVFRGRARRAGYDPLSSRAGSRGKRSARCAGEQAGLTARYGDRRRHRRS